VKTAVSTIVGIAVATAVLLVGFPKCGLSLYISSHLSILINSQGQIGNLEPRTALTTGSIAIILLVVGLWPSRSRTSDDNELI
jgi:hypothetical protein